MSWYDFWNWNDTPVNADQWDVTATLDADHPTWVRNVQVDPDAGSSSAEDSASEFIYLDVGLWGGAPSDGEEAYQRNFAVVCGNHILLCNFVTSGGNFGENAVAAWKGGPAADQYEEIAPAFTILQALAGSDSRVQLIKAVSYNGLSRRNRDPEFIYVFLPDTHIPVLTTLPAEETNTSLEKPVYEGDGAAMGRYEYFDLNPMAGRSIISRRDQLLPDPYDGCVTDPSTGARVLGYGAEQWFDRYLAADISKHEAAEDLIEFIDRLEKVNDRRIKLVQLGDMIDLWIGFDAFFEITPSSAPDVILRQGKPVSWLNAHPEPSGTDFVNYWVARAVTQPPAPPATAGHAEALQRVAQFKYNKAFIYGNHDCYLKVVSPASIGGDRVESLLEDGLYAEHGHQYDSFNRDGAGAFWTTKGQTVTNQVFKRPPLRYAYPMVPGTDIRGQALEGAAKQWLKKRFVIYVQGHTHCYGLGLVKLTMKMQKAVEPRPPSNARGIY